MINVRTNFYAACAGKLNFRKKTNERNIRALKSFAACPGILKILYLYPPLPICNTDWLFFNHCRQKDSPHSGKRKNDTNETGISRCLIKERISQAFHSAKRFAAQRQTQKRYE